MDHDASSHITANAGIFSSEFNSNPKRYTILVGNDHLIPVVGYDMTNLPPPHPPFVLQNMLNTPKVIKHMIFVRKFTTNYFDIFGFSINDL